MKGIKICKKCGKKIGINDKYDMLGTFIGEKSIRKDFWHHNCFLEWFNTSLENKAKELYSKAIAGAMKSIGIAYNGQEETKVNLHTMGLS